MHTHRYLSCHSHIITVTDYRTYAYTYSYRRRTFMVIDPPVGRVLCGALIRFEIKPNMILNVEFERFNRRVYIAIK